VATYPAPLIPPAQTAGFEIRLLAYLADAFVVGLVGGAPFLSVSAQNGVQHAQNAYGGSLLISFIYFVFFWSHRGGGRTLGMRLFGLRVVQQDGQLLGLRAALLRFIGLFISFAVCFLGVLWVAIDPRMLGWHDKLAHTLVVRV
jgi:uncharacterized RDD family membrane protein YckC